jgi:type II secretory pathway pseudopilin PulG
MKFTWIERLMNFYRRESDRNVDEPPAMPAAKGRWLQLGIALGVILLLVGTCLPALSNAREKARRSSCNCNLKQIGLAMRLYAGDQGHWFPCDPEATVLGSYAMLTNSYLSAPKTWMCPSDSGVSGCGSPVAGSQPVNPFKPNRVGYAYGGFGLNELAPPDTPLACDRTSGEITSATPWKGNRWTHKEDGGTTLFADGLVEWRKTLNPPMYRAKNP